MSPVRKQNDIVKTAMQHWKYLAPILIQPKDDTEYDFLVTQLDKFLDIIGDDEGHPLMSLVDLLSQLIALYDQKRFDLTSLKGIHALKYLMEIKQLKQADLHAIGSQGVVSEILNGKRKLNVKQIIKLSKLFKVNPETFIDE